MLTIFTIPKAFTGHIGVIQRNAIQSWTKLEPRPEIILFGRDAGTAELARELGLRHEPDVALTEHGTPLVNDLFEKAERAASGACMCYVNADIILMRDFLRALEIVARRMPCSLMVSKRIDLDVPEPLEFAAGWEKQLAQRLRANGAEGHHSSIDAFVYAKGMYAKIPAFAIGRLWWDHWLIKAVREQKVPVVDASRVAPLLHQKHDYNHVQGGEEQVWRGAEAKKNLELYGGAKNAYTLLDATHELMEDGSIRAVRFRKPVYKIKEAAWDLLVRRTAGARHALGLRRRPLRAESKPGT